MQTRLGRGMCGQYQPGNIEQAGQDQHAVASVFIRQHPGKRLRQAPDKVLNGNGQPECGPGKLKVGDYRLQEHAEGLPDAHADGNNRAPDKHQQYEL